MGTASASARRVYLVRLRVCPSALDDAIENIDELRYHVIGRVRDEMLYQFRDILLCRGRSEHFDRFSKWNSLLILFRFFNERPE